MNRGAAVAAALAEPVRRKEIVSVYAAAVIQGVALVTFPAASVVFTSAADYGLTNQEYGGIFVPQAITAIVSSLLGAGLSRRIGAKQVYLLGLHANLLAMALLVCSRSFPSSTPNSTAICGTSAAVMMPAKVSAFASNGCRMAAGWCRNRTRDRAGNATASRWS